jgi:large subunit ribosomal protein L23
MNLERVMTVVKGPHTSEKAALLADKHNQIVFKVACSATKREVKAAVEKIFEVKVDSVTVVNMKGKRKQFAQRQGRRNNFKKAYVSLKEGFDIDFATTE